MVVLVVSHVSGQRRTWCIQDHTPTGHDLLHALTRREGCASEVVLQSRGRILGPTTPVEDGSMVVATLRLPGGKGGFGSMLRAIGAQIEKTTNREACRDLSGRRLRDINEEKRLKDFISKKADRERELQEKKQQKIRMLQETPRHTFQDESYFKQRELREKNLYDSLDKAFEKSSGGPSTSTKGSVKDKPVANVKKGRLMDDLEESSSEEEGEDDEKVSTVEEQTNGESSKHLRQDDDEATSASKAPEAKTDCGSSSTTKRSMEEEPAANIKRGRFIDDLDESSGEEEEKATLKNTTISTVKSKDEGKET